MDKHRSVLGSEDPCEISMNFPQIEPQEGIKIVYHTAKEQMKVTWTNGHLTCEKFSIMGPSGIFFTLRKKFSY